MTATQPATQTRGPRPAAPRLIPILAQLRRSGVLIPLVILFTVLAFASAPFATSANLLNLIDQQSSILIIAAAGTLLFVSGGFDLSVGAVYALSGVVSAGLAQQGSGPIAGLAGLALGALVGLVNGLVVVYLRVNALIATLAVSFVVLGVASLATSGNSITLYSQPGYGVLAQTRILGVLSSTWITLIVVCVLGVALWATTFGRYLYAVGGNENAARLAGVRVSGVRIAAFVISGTAAGLGGLIDSSRVLSAQASNGGDALTFTVIASIVVGGTSIMGGEGTVWKSVVGVMFLALIGNGYNLLGLDPLYQQITLGALILLSVSLHGLGRVVQRLRRLSTFRLPVR
ncbi:ABC transporter permease [Sinomonas sp. G460-2]|uniref:ABC transporter permease n=1 Tax=Sinomonas sp. G460-2 TaxID=3393464 RepID=UPI0039F0B4EA